MILKINSLLGLPSLKQAYIIGYPTVDTGGSRNTIFDLFQAVSGVQKDTILARRLELQRRGYRGLKSLVGDTLAVGACRRRDSGTGECSSFEHSFRMFVCLYSTAKILRLGLLNVVDLARKLIERCGHGHHIKHTRCFG